MRHLIDFRPAAGLMLVPPLLLPGYDHLEHPSKHVPRAAAVLCFLSAAFYLHLRLHADRASLSSCA